MPVPIQLVKDGDILLTIIIYEKGLASSPPESRFKDWAKYPWTLSSCASKQKLLHG